MTVVAPFPGLTAPGLSARTGRAGRVRFIRRLKSAATYLITSEFQKCQPKADPCPTAGRRAPPSGPSPSGRGQAGNSDSPHCFALRSKALGGPDRRQFRCDPRVCPAKGRGYGARRACTGKCNWQAREDSVRLPVSRKRLMLIYANLYAIASNIYALPWLLL